MVNNHNTNSGTGRPRKSWERPWIDVGAKGVLDSDPYEGIDNPGTAGIIGSTLREGETYPLNLRKRRRLPQY